MPVASSVTAADPALLPFGAAHELRALLDAIPAGGRFEVRGSAGSSTMLLAAALAVSRACAPSPLLLTTAHLDDADEITDELAAREIDAIRFPALEVLPGESAVALDLFAERIAAVRRLLSQAPPRVLVAPIQALMQLVPSPARIESLTRTLRSGDLHPPERLIEWLTAAGYNRLDSIEEPGDFAVRGGIIDLFPPAGAAQRTADARAHSSRTEDAPPVRLDFFGDEIESIREIDLDTMGSDRKLDAVELIGVDPAAIANDEHTVSLIDLLPAGAVSILAEPIEATEQGRGYYERVTDARGIVGPPAVFQALQTTPSAHIEVSQFSATDPLIELPVRTLPEFARDAEAAIAELAELAGGRRTIVYCQNEGESQRLGELLAEFAPEAPVELVTLYLHRGLLVDTPEPLALVPHHELLHRYQTRRRIRKLRAGKATDAFLDLSPGDYVVHADHGIAKFTGLRALRPKERRKAAEEKTRDTLRKLARDEHEPDRPGAEEFLTLEFAAKAKLHVPVTQIDKVQRYIGGKGAPTLSTLGGKKWQNQKAQVKESVRDLAAEMLRVQAARNAMPGLRFPADTAWQREFEAEFPYQETADQLAALSEIKNDMAGPRPMDRLLCGDVGYGKTEVAIRAAFKAAEFGKQVAVLVPTTLLCEQHERTFKSRFAGYPFRVEALSRFKSTKETNQILKALRQGQADVVIGTHRLLSKDVRFADLGLVVVDEEQRFGVEHKQRLLELRLTADVLTLSATPIPRTLHMSMLGLRDISSLTTPPLDRRAVVTEVMPYNETRIKRAIERELSREGQVYFVHNRVHNIRSIADDVRRLVPGARIDIGHGQMPDTELEAVMRRFTRRETDILVATTIIESGIDIPTANTMFINSADLFGLAELHQLRGRVGRSKHRGYCYLLLPKDRAVNEVAVKRLRAIEEFSMLGSGFKIAMRDLEIRGAGNLLGAEQSGHIAAVGYDMYCQLLEQAAGELQDRDTRKTSETTLELGITGAIPKTYIPSDQRRLEAYRRLATARTPAEADDVEKDLRDAYADPPPVTQTLIELARIRAAAAAHRIRSIALVERDVVFKGEDEEAITDRLAGIQGTVRPLTRRSPGEPATVHLRLPQAYLEPATLLTLLRTRLA